VLVLDGDVLPREAPETALAQVHLRQHPNGSVHSPNGDARRAANGSSRGETDQEENGKAENAFAYGGAK
jgi:hypothetical protein